MPTTAAAVAHRDHIRAVLRDHPIAMTCAEIAKLLDPQLAATPYGLQRRRLTTPEIYGHCKALAFHGYLRHHHPDDDQPSRFAWLPPAPGGHRGVELWETQQFAALASLAGDPGPTR